MSIRAWIENHYGAAATGALVLLGGAALRFTLWQSGSASPMPDGDVAF